MEVSHEALNQCQGQLGAAEQRIVDLNAKLTQLEASHDDLKHQMAVNSLSADTNSESLNLRSQLSAKEIITQSLEADVASLKSKLQEKTEAIFALQSENSSIRTKLHVLNVLLFDISIFL